MPNEQLTTIEPLSTDKCLRLLASQRIGRLAVADDNCVRIFPVNYLVDGDAVVIRSETNALVAALPYIGSSSRSTPSTPTTAPAGRD